MTARAKILGRLRSKRGYLPSVEAVAAREPTTIPAEECAARFLAEAAALGVDCFVEGTAAAVAERLSIVVGGSRVLSWDAAALPYDAARALPRTTSGRASLQEQAAAEIGVTGCDAAVAETASLVLFSGPGRSRTVSLLPPVHVAIVQRGQLFFSMAEFLRTHAERISRTAACTVITGPSRTADIELTLTLGIHGPGQVIVILGP